MIYRRCQTMSHSRKSHLEELFGFCRSQAKDRDTARQPFFYPIHMNAPYCSNADMHTHLQYGDGEIQLR